MSDDNIDILSPNEELIVVGFTLFASGLSLLGAGFIMWVYLRFESLRNFAFKLIYWLSVSDFIFCAGKLLLIFRLSDFPNNMWTRTPDYLCNAQSIMINFGGLASITCTVAIAWALYITLIKAEIQAEGKYQTILWRICYGIPLFMSIM